MTKKYIFILCTILCIGQTIAQYTSIPDTCFENILVSQNIDSDNTVNGQVLTSDINTITYLDISANIHTCGVSDITGIEDFTLLEVLVVKDANLTSIDMSSNLNLKRLFCKNNAISQINVTQNILLERLSCSNNNINSIDLTHNDLLISLNVGHNSITNLNTGINILLQNLLCESNLLTNLSLNSNTELVLLSFSNNQINSIDLTSFNLLKYLDFSKYTNNFNRHISK